MIAVSWYRGYQIVLVRKTLEYRITKGEECFGYANSVKKAQIEIDEMENPE